MYRRFKRMLLGVRNRFWQGSAPSSRRRRLFLIFVAAQRADIVRGVHIVDEFAFIRLARPQNKLFPDSPDP